MLEVIYRGAVGQQTIRSEWLYNTGKEALLLFSQVSQHLAMQSASLSCTSASASLDDKGVI